MTDPHAGQPVYQRGVALEEAKLALIMIHGRGASAQDILTIADYLELDGVTCLAPEAAQSVWYPQRFIVPTALNQPWLDSALATVGRLIAHADAAGIPAERTMLLGFSQGACLSLEYAARNPRRYGAVFALSGALIEEGDEPRAYEGSLEQTPVFIGCSDIDVHIPHGRVERSGEIMQSLGADVDLRIYPGMGHTVNDDEIAAINAIIAKVRG